MKNETKHASDDIKDLLNKSKSTLTREPHRISNQETNRLGKIFDKCNSLKIAYQLKNKLFDILHARNLKHENFIETINAWCIEAKSQGIDCLDDFSESLKGY